MPVTQISAGRMRLRNLAVLTALGLLGACASLPSSGPTAGDIRRDAKPDRNEIGFKIVDIDAPLIAAIDTRNAAADQTIATLASLHRPARNDAVGPGDVLAVGIYEVGVSLFGQSRDMGTAYDPSARPEQFNSIVVDRSGAIRLPYVGRLQVAGKTPAEIQAMIERGMRGKSQTPQALVAVRLNVSNTVFVGGDVRRPGRFDLTLQNERLLDAIALGGGATYSSEDTIVRFNRGSQTVEERLGRIRSGAPDDLVLTPGDRIELIKRPRSFIVLGATGKIAQMPFETGDLSIAEAVARAGGPTDAQADPRAVFLFRYDPVAAGSDPNAQPVIYRLDMMAASSYFFSQHFTIRDKDVIYIANAAANRPAKLIDVINRLFGPAITARAIAN